MQLDLEIRNGRPERPGVVLVHGLGMNRRFWGTPAQCHALGGLASLGVFLAGPPAGEAPGRLSTGVAAPCRGLADLLAEQGLGVASWSQRSPVGPACEPLAELAAVIAELKARWPGRPLYLIGHSRGGLLARAHLLAHDDERLAGLVTLGTPHAGSRMAAISGFLRPGGRLLAKLLPKEARRPTAAALARMTAFLESPAIGEMEPGCSFIRDTCRPLPARLRKLSLGGTDPALFRLYLRPTPLSPWKALTFPDFLLKAVPAGRRPAEITPGQGDGLVSAASAILAGGSHLDLDCNHVGLAFDPRAQQTVLDFLLLRSG
jgi:pimeloyl-ACP methyl ester carboxylesterase